MKKLWIFALVALTMAACKKDKSGTQNNNQPTYEEKLVGNWTLSAIHYETEIPDFGGGAPIPVEDDGTNVVGEFNITKDPNNVSYNYSFSAKVPNPLGGTVNVPISQQASGTWTVASDNSAIYLTTDEGTTIFKVMENEDNRQVLRTTVPYSLPVLGAIEVITLITLQR